MVKIYLFELGYAYGVNLRKAAKLINISPDIIRATIGDAIRNIGEPDLYGVAYSNSKAFGLFPELGDGTIRVGIIAMPIEGNFYYRRRGDAVIITLSQIDEVCERSGRSKEEYIALTVLTAVLSMLYKAQKSATLFHNDTRGCIFDHCIHKPDKVQKLRLGLICPICKGKLVEANIPENILDTVERGLAQIRKPTFFRTFQTSMQKPFFSFVLGGLFLGLIINTISSLALGEFDSSADYLFVLTLIGLTLLLVLGNYVQAIVSNRKFQAF